MLKALVTSYSQMSRRRRAKILWQHFEPKPDWRILDLGGGTGAHIKNVFPNHKNIVVCDMSTSDLEVARSLYGYQTVQLEVEKTLPFADKEFDLVFCSSVIEHVTGNKAVVTRIQDTEEFQKIALLNQKAFASEISRIGKRFYVQTPYKYFIVESHSWLPIFIVYLNRRDQIRLLRFLKNLKFWPKTTEPDWNLLVPKDMTQLFPGSKIILEKQLGLTKSIISIKSIS